MLRSSRFHHIQRVGRLVVWMPSQVRVVTDAAGAEPYGPVRCLGTVGRDPAVPRTLPPRRFVRRGVPRTDLLTPGALQRFRLRRGPPRPPRVRPSCNPSAIRAPEGTVEVPPARESSLYLDGVPRPVEIDGRGHCTDSVGRRARQRVAGKKLHIERSRSSAAACLLSAGVAACLLSASACFACPPRGSREDGARAKRLGLIRREPARAALCARATPPPAGGRRRTPRGDRSADRR